MKFDRKVSWVKKVRARARRLQGCRCGRKNVEVGIKSSISLNTMLRSGASIKELKDAIQKHGWWCRKCVRKWQGTAAATANLRDQFPPGPEGQRAFNRHRYEANKDLMRTHGYLLIWNEDEGTFRMELLATPGPKPVTV